jgi:uncharacterized protein (TIGR02246 family)
MIDVSAVGGVTIIDADVTFQASAFLGEAPQDQIVLEKLERVFDELKSELDRKAKAGAAKVAPPAQRIVPVASVPVDPVVAVVRDEPDSGVSRAPVEAIARVEEHSAETAPIVGATAPAPKVEGPSEIRFAEPEPIVIAEPEAALEPAKTFPEPEPVVVVEPEPASTHAEAIAEPEPIVVVEPEPASTPAEAIAKPEPIVVAEPVASLEPAKTFREQEPEPIVVVEPEPASTPAEAIAKPKPIVVVEPEAALEPAKALAEAEPIVVVEPDAASEPVEAFTEPEPVVIEKPVPVAVARPDVVVVARKVDPASAERKREAERWVATALSDLDRKEPGAWRRVGWSVAAVALVGIMTLSLRDLMNLDKSQGRAERPVTVAAMTPTSVSASATPSTTPAAPPTEAAATPAAAPEPKPSLPEASDDPAAVVKQWEQAMQSRDAAAQASFYADPVGRYFLRNNVGRDAVLADKRAAIDKRKDNWTVKMDRVKVDRRGDAATVMLVKHFMVKKDGEPGSEWFIPSQLKLKREDGKWRIVSERDLGWASSLDELDG